MAMFLLLGACFLDRLLKLVQFLAQLRERLRSGVGFLSAFLGITEIGFIPFHLSQTDNNLWYCALYVHPHASCKDCNVS
jgi:hypothetical protein